MAQRQASPKQPFLPQTVIVLGLVSLLNDTASEMITPILPLFLTATLGASPVAVGLIEGVAEATASLLKLISGRLADRGWGHKRLVLSGYGISNIARPLIGLALSWPWVLLLRFFDRVGKGIRTSPRDALIAGAADQHIRGRAFGFHRAMDHTGAVVGPLLAFVLLQQGVALKNVFLLSVVPGTLLILLLWWALPGRESDPPARPTPPPLHWRGLDRHVRAMVLSAGALAFATAPDAFLILWASRQGVATVWVPLLWAATHAVRAVIAGAGGTLSDRVGRLPIVTTGWLGRIVLLVLLAWAPAGVGLAWLLFLTYSATTAFTEGAERAIIGDFAPADQKATAFGLYHMLIGLLALPGALLFSALWEWVSVSSAFMAAAILTGGAVTALLWLSTRGQRS